MNIIKELKVIKKELIKELSQIKKYKIHGDIRNIEMGWFVESNEAIVYRYLRIDKCNVYRERVYNTNRTSWIKLQDLDIETLYKIYLDYKKYSKNL